MSDEKKPEELYAAVLLPEIPIFRAVARKAEPDVLSAYMRDASVLPFVIEELISQGAIHLAVDRSSMLGDSIELVPEAFRSRIWAINTKRNNLGKIDDIMSPIFDELRIQREGLGFRGPEQQTEQAMAAISLWAELEPFLLGLDYQLQVQLNLDQVRESLSTLDRHLSAPDARAHLAHLKQVFGAYEKREVRELELTPASDHQRAAAFQRFVEDVHYRDLSKERRLFGFPALAERAVMKFDRLVDTMISSSSFRHMLSLGAKSLEVATKIPLPDVKALEALTSDSYLPPVVSLRASLMRARDAWRRAKPPFLPPAGKATDNEQVGELIAFETDKAIDIQ